MEIELGQKSGMDQMDEANFNIQLTSKQMNFLSTQLPLGYSFQIDSKNSKRASKAVKLSSVDPPSSVVALQSEGNISSSSRIKKVSSTVAYNQQIQNSFSNPKAGVNKTLSATNVSQQLKPCVKILNSLKGHKTAWPFLQPVDPVGMGIPHYKEIVQQPMDLRTIQNHILNNDYATPTQFHADINKVIKNSYLFNKDNKDFFKLTQEFQKYYNKLIGQPNKKKDTPVVNPQPPSNLQTNKSTPSTKMIKKPSAPNRDPAQLRPPTLAQKKQLTQNIKRLSKQDLKGMITIIYPNPNDVKDNLDIEELEPLKIRQLQKYVASKLVSITKQ